MIAAGLAYRESIPGGEPRGTLLCLHGYPQSSAMWEAVLAAAAGSGWRAVAPDLAGYGDSPVDRPATWARHVAALERFRAALALDRVVLCVHDWGGLIGLRWACDHPDSVRGLVISDTGFFPDGRWHGLARVLRTPGEGEEAIAQMTHESFAALLGALSPNMSRAAIDHYWRAYADDDRRAAQLELYRSGEFAELAPYEGRLAALGVPTLLLWGADDAFAPVAGAHRLRREVPGAELRILDGAGHFLYDDRPDAAAAEVAAFLGRLPRETGAR